MEKIIQQLGGPHRLAIQSYTKGRDESSRVESGGARGLEIPMTRVHMYVVR